MSEKITLKINGNSVEVEKGNTVASAIFASSAKFFRYSIKGFERSAMCGMGICFECRVKINGINHQRSCLIPAENGMEIETDG